MFIHLSLSFYPLCLIHGDSICSMLGVFLGDQLGSLVLDLNLCHGPEEILSFPPCCFLSWLILASRPSRQCLWQSPESSNPRALSTCRRHKVLILTDEHQETRNVNRALLSLQGGDVLAVFCQESWELMWLTAWWLPCYLHGQATLTPRLFSLSQSIYCTSLPETLIRSIVCLEPTPSVNL